MRTSLPRSLVASVAGLLSVAASTQSTAAQTTPANDEWKVSIVPYLWIPAVDTTFGLDGIPSDGESNTTGFDVFQELEFALMGTAEVRKGRFALIGDFQYVKLGSDFSASLPLGNVADANYDLSIASGLALVSYRIVDEPQFHLDGAAGARLLWAEISAGLESTAGVSFDADDDVTLVDPVVAMRARYLFDEKWAITGMGNVGGFGVGTDFTWEALGTVDYRFNEHFELRVGYRAFSIDLDTDNLELETLLHGPIVGLVITF